MLLYALLLFWLLPAVTLIVVYSCDRLWTAVHVYVLKVPVGRRSVAVVCGGARERTNAIGRAPGAAAGSQLRVPLVIEDEGGNLHMRHWHICLN